MEQELKVLKAMSEVKGHTDLNHFAETVGLTPQQTTEIMQDLTKNGYLKKSPRGGYGITEKGKNALRSIATVQTGKEFHFFMEIGHPADLTATNLKEFEDAIKKLDSKSLEFHLYRGDFENWIGTAIEDVGLASSLAEIRVKGLKGEELREAIMRAVENKIIL